MVSRLIILSILHYFQMSHHECSTPETKIIYVKCISTKNQRKTILWNVMTLMNSFLLSWKDANRYHFHLKVDYQHRHILGLLGWPSTVCYSLHYWLGTYCHLQEEWRKYVRELLIPYKVSQFGFMFFLGDVLQAYKCTHIYTMDTFK